VHTLCSYTVLIHTVLIHWCSYTLCSYTHTHYVHTLCADRVLALCSDHWRAVCDGALRRSQYVTSLMDGMLDLGTLSIHDAPHTTLIHYVLRTIHYVPCTVRYAPLICYPGMHLYYTLCTINMLSRDARLRKATGGYPAAGVEAAGDA
jgi:hypothetical protein